MKELGLAETTSTEAACGTISQLPAEVRLAILGYVLIPGKIYLKRTSNCSIAATSSIRRLNIQPHFTTLSEPGYSWTPPAEFKPSSQVFRVSQQFYNDGLELLYKKNVIHVIDEHRFETLAAFLYTIGARNCERIRNIDITRCDSRSVLALNSRQSTSLFSDLANLDLCVPGLTGIRSLNIYYEFDLADRVYFGLPSEVSEPSVNTDEDFMVWWKRTGIAVAFTIHPGATGLRYVVGKERHQSECLLVSLVADASDIILEDHEYLVGEVTEGQDDSDE